MTLLETQLRQGHAHMGKGEYEQARQAFARAVTLRPKDARGHFFLGNALRMLDSLGAAVSSYDRAIALDGRNTNFHFNRAVALHHFGQRDAAIAGYDKAIALKKDHAEAYSNRGVALRDLHQQQAAIDSFDRAIAVRPDYAEAYLNRGHALQDLNCLAEAVASYDKVIALSPNTAQAYVSRGHALVALNDLEAAIASYYRAVALDPSALDLVGSLAIAKAKACDWQGLRECLNGAATGTRAGARMITPFDALCLIDAPDLQKRAAQTYAEQFPASPSLGPIKRRHRPVKTRIGYYSADFHGHATSFLMADLFETHDRSRFEVFGFSTGLAPTDDMRRRLASAFDRFIDVSGRSDIQVARISRGLGIDIAVDLKGYTAGARMGIFAERCAPMQASYLGYPGTTGASFIDYLIADRTIISEERRTDFTEKIVYLPNCYQVNSKRPIAERVPTRAEVGLPDAGFVFCCFNNNWKITPAIFDVWMRLLRTVDGSVLWLLKDNTSAARNLLREAAARDIHGARLVFADRVPLDQHMARHQLADLFLDTLPCNAHTTASDALWAGLPVLTLMGTALAGRVAGSILKAVGLPELITTTEQQYEAAALDFARDPSKLAAIRQRLAANLTATPLFDVRRFARDIEAAYLTMMDRHHAGLPIEHFAV